MRYPAEHKEEARRQILAIASERLRRDGIAGVGLRTLMTDAGLTHGAFYAHFKSRADLIEQAIDFAFDQTSCALANAVEARPEEPLRAFFERYLRPEHRDEAAQGCASASFAPEIARLGGEVQQAFARGIERLVMTLEPLLPAGGAAEERRARAHSILGALFGSLQLARALPDEAASLALLITGRNSAMLMATAPWLSDGDAL